MDRPKKTLKGGFLQQAKGDCRIKSTQINCFCETVRRKARPYARRPRALKTMLAQGGPSGSSRSNQMVLVMAKHKAEPHER